jgi:hypothetical protein
MAIGPAPVRKVADRIEVADGLGLNRFLPNIQPSKVVLPSCSEPSPHVAVIRATHPVPGSAVPEPDWTQVSTTIKGRKIEGEYCREGHLVRVRHGNREKGGDPAILE